MTAVIFDFDGVVVNSEVLWAKSNKEIFQKLIAEEWTDKHKAAITGMSMQQIRAWLEKEHNVTITLEKLQEAVGAVAVGIYKEQCQLLPGVEKLIQDLHAERIPMAIASGSPSKWIRLSLERFSLTSYFQDIASVYDLDLPGKPNPDVFLKAAELIGKTPEECIVFEDSVAGVNAAKAAGMRCIGVSGPHNFAMKLDVDSIPDFTQVTVDSLLRK